jgi:hypothetical protein
LPRNVLLAVVLSGLLGFAAAFAVGSAFKPDHAAPPAFTAAPAVPAIHPAIDATWVSAAVPGLTTVAATPPPAAVQAPSPQTTTSAPATASPTPAPHPTPGPTGGGGGGGGGGG